MPTRIVISPEIPGGEGIRALPFDRFLADSGEVVARSRSSDTVACELEGIHLHLKRYRYSIRQTIRGMFRNTLFGRSRVAREYAMLSRVAERLGKEVVPAAIACGERRRFGFLRAAFLATRTLPDVLPVTETVDAVALGRFLRTIHDRGFSHGRLYGRNLLVSPGRAFHLVDLDRAVLTRDPAAGVRAGLDIACVLASLPTLDGDELLSGYGKPEIRGTVAELQPMARAGFARRSGPPHL